MFKKTINNTQDQAETILKEIASGKASFIKPEPDKLDPPAEIQTTAPEPKSDMAEWKRKETKVKTTVRCCIVIDRDDHWHDQAQVDLKGIDATAFTWGYYGAKLPILVESLDQSGTLTPWYYGDAAGESSNRLFKGANPDGYKSAFKHRGNMLQKITIGLLIALILGLFFFMFILINN
jgi:hypothetical protein